MKRNGIIAGIFFLLVLVACDSNSLEVDLDTTKKYATIKHYDSDLFALDRNNLAQSISSIAKDYEVFLGKDYNNPANLAQLSGYVNDPNNQKIAKDLKDVFGDYKEFDAELNKAFGHLLYYYPEDSGVHVYTYNSALEIYKPFLFNPEGRDIIIAADVFTGKNDRAYARMKVPQFISKKFQKKYLIPELFRTIGKNKFGAFLKGETMLEAMIANGKIEYFVEAMTPELHDSIRFVYNPTQMDWCYNRTDKFWLHLVSEDLLYSKDYHEFKKYIEERPFASSQEKGSPGRAGIWVGYQIVKEYMRRNPEITLQEMMANGDLMSIFNGSKYNP